MKVPSRPFLLKIIGSALLVVFCVYIYRVFMKREGFAPAPDVPKICGTLGVPDKDYSMRIYTPAECTALKGKYGPINEKFGACKAADGSINYSIDCAGLNGPNPYAAKADVITSGDKKAYIGDQANFSTVNKADAMTSVMNAPPSMNDSVIGACKSLLRSLGT